MENEKLHQLTQELINQINSSTYLHAPKHQESKNISSSDWNEIINPLLKKKYVEKSSNTLLRLTSRGKKLTGDRYLRIEKQNKVEKQQKEKKNLLSQKKLAPKNIPAQQKLVPERKETQELSSDSSSPAMWQKVMFWIVSIVGILGGACGIIALWMQLHTKPIVEKKYIPVDSHGKTYDLQKKE
jgi:hypothetical protein